MNKDQREQIISSIESNFNYNSYNFQNNFGSNGAYLLTGLFSELITVVRILHESIEDREENQ